MKSNIFINLILLQVAVGCYESFEPEYFQPVGLHQEFVVLERYVALR